MSQQIIDAYMGAGWYDHWVELQRRLRVEKTRSKPIRDRAGAFDEGLWLSLDKAERLEFDYGEAMRLIASGKRLDKKEVEDIAVLFELAIDTVEKQVDLLEAIQMVGLAAAWVAFPFAIFATKADFLLKALEELKKLLEKARREVREAWMQKGLDVGFAIVTALLPGLGLISKFAIGAAKLSYDHFLGPKEPGPDKYARTTYTTYYKELSQVKGISERSGQVISKGGKIVKYYGLALDWGEILRGYDNVDKIEAAMKQTRAAHDAIVKLFKDNEAKLRTMAIQFERAEVRIKESRREAGDLSGILYEEIKAANYTSPKTWRILQ